MVKLGSALLSIYYCYHYHHFIFINIIIIIIIIFIIYTGLTHKCRDIGKVISKQDCQASSTQHNEYS